MTLIDGCLLVGANDNRLVKRTIPIMNGEEANVLSAFTYPLPLTNAVPDNGIEKDPTDSSDNVDTEKSNGTRIFSMLNLTTLLVRFLFVTVYYFLTSYEGLRCRLFRSCW